MINEHFKLGDPVYVLHIANYTGAHLSYAMIVGVKGNFRTHNIERFSGDLISNIDEVIYQVIRIHESDETGNFFLLNQDIEFPIPSHLVFETKEDAKLYLHTVADKLELYSEGFSQ